MRRETTRASRSLRRESRSGGGRRRRTQRLIHRAACRRAKAAVRHLVTAARPPDTGAIAAPRTRRLILVAIRPRRMLRAQCNWRSSCRCTTSTTIRRAPSRRCTDTSSGTSPGNSRSGPSSPSPATAALTAPARSAPGWLRACLAVRLVRTGQPGRGVRSPRCGPALRPGSSPTRMSACPPT